jgi:hypothetical protein
MRTSALPGEPSGDDQVLPHFFVLGPRGDREAYWTARFYGSVSGAG